jgi:hypothetical protein
MGSVEKPRVSNYRRPSMLCCCLERSMQGLAQANHAPARPPSANGPAAAGPAAMAAMPLPAAARIAVVVMRRLCMQSKAGGQYGHQARRRRECRLSCMMIVTIERVFQVFLGCYTTMIRRQTTSISGLRGKPSGFAGVPIRHLQTRQHLQQRVISTHTVDMCSLSCVFPIHCYAGLL